MGVETEPSEPIDVAAVLGAVALFDALGADELRRLAATASFVTLPRGEAVFREGDEAESCFVVVTGEVDVTTGSVVAGGTPLQVRRLGPGELFGEMGVLLGRSRTATVTATRAVRLLRFPAEELRRIVTSNPRALERVSQMLAARLVSTTRGDRTSNAPRVVVVVGERGVKGRSLVAASVATLLHQITGRAAAWVEVDVAREGERSVGARRAERAGSAPDLHHLALALDDLAGPAGVAALAGEIERLRSEHVFVVVDVPERLGLSPAGAAEIGDAVIHVSHRVTLPAAPPGARRLVVLNLHDDRAHPVSLDENEPFVLRSDRDLAEGGAIAASERIRVDAWSHNSRTLRRLVRTLLGSTVGVALGGGAAFGLAHVGVLEALDAHGVPVDLVVGTSMGSIVATGYAAGIPSSEIHEIAERVGHSIRTFIGLIDVNPTTSGVLSGRRLQRTFNPMLGSARTFEDLVVPCRTVAADVESGQRVCIGTGRLEDAFRASSSIPMLISPWLHNGHVLVDGAMVDPVPAEVAREMGADLVIAVNVVPHLRKGTTTVISRVAHGVSRFNPLSIARGGRGLPTIVDTAMNTIQSLQHELGHFKAASADIRINPELADITWIEFYKAAVIIERGRLATEAALPAISRMLDERLAAALPA